MRHVLRRRQQRQRPGPSIVALVGLFGTTVGGSYPCTGNRIVGNFSNIGVVWFEDALSAGFNLLLGGGQSDVQRIPGLLRLDAALTIPTVWALKNPAGRHPVLHLRGHRPNHLTGPTALVGNSAGAGTTYLAIGNHSTAPDAQIRLDAPTGQVNTLSYWRNNVQSWRIYDANSTSLFIRDEINGVMAITIAPGAGTAGLATIGGGGLKIAGKVGFNGTNRSRNRPPPRPTRPTWLPH